MKNKDIIRTSERQTLCTTTLDNRKLLNMKDISDSIYRTKTRNHRSSLLHTSSTTQRSKLSSNLNPSLNKFIIHSNLNKSASNYNFKKSKCHLGREGNGDRNEDGDDNFGKGFMQKASKTFYNDSCSDVYSLLSSSSSNRLSIKSIKPIRHGLHHFSSKDKQNQQEHPFIRTSLHKYFGIQDKDD